jgi:hypothetical protein
VPPWRCGWPCRSARRGRWRLVVEEAGAQTLRRRCRDVRRSLDEQRAARPGTGHGWRSRKRRRRGVRCGEEERREHRSGRCRCVAGAWQHAPLVCVGVQQRCARRGCGGEISIAGPLRAAGPRLNSQAVGSTACKRSKKASELRGSRWSTASGASSGPSVDGLGRQRWWLRGEPCSDTAAPAGFWSMSAPADTAYASCSALAEPSASGCAIMWSRLPSHAAASSCSCPCSEARRP